jgi:cytochrome c oxidase subunit 3
MVRSTTALVLLMPTITEDAPTIQIEERPDVLDGVGPPPRPPEQGGGDDGRRPDPESTFPVSKGRLALWLVLTVVIMLFAGFTSAYIVLRGVPGWQSVALPPSLWVSTFILLASSVTMEWTRKRMSRGNTASAKVWMGATAGLGLAFLVGQLVAWNQLADAGVYLASTLHSSFLYILTGIHAIHLLGGLSALGYVTTQIFRNRYSATNHEPVVLCATYWHFMDGLWVFLFLLFTLA